MKDHIVPGVSAENVSGKYVLEIGVQTGATLRLYTYIISL